jgi:hypothetical protein
MMWFEIETRSIVGRPIQVLASSMILLAVMVTAYALIAPAGATPTPGVVDVLFVPSLWYFLLLGVGTILLMLYLSRYLRTRGNELATGGSVPLSPSHIVPFILSRRRYYLVFGLSAFLYALLYGFLTGIVAYRPGVDFSQFPGLAIPSVQPDQLVGSPLFVPELTVFLSNHVALLLIPITLIMMVVVSVLVGVNFALSVFAYDNRVRGRRGSLGGQLGALVGLFTGCPTCAGLYFFSVLGGSGAVSVAVTLDYYQPLFVILSIPVLLASPYLISRSLSKVFRDGCVVVSTSHQRP